MADEIAPEDAVDRCSSMSCGMDVDLHCQQTTNCLPLTKGVLCRAQSCHLLIIFIDILGSYEPSNIVSDYDENPTPVCRCRNEDELVGNCSLKSTK